MGVPTFNVLSLCSGVGGLDLGVRMAIPHARTVCYVEREAHCCEVLAERMEDGSLDEAPVWTDIRSFDGEPWRGVVDCIIGGYPCQPFSVAGRKKGTKDDRHLWPHIATIIRDVAPQWCFFENVLGHLRLGFEQVEGELRRMGYVTAAGVFSAEEVGATHQRRRLFFVAYAGRQRREETALGFPEQEEEDGPGGWIEQDEDHQPVGHGQALAGALPVHPPGPTDRRGWIRALSVSPKIEPAVRGVADGMADWMDRLRECGNGVYPLAAAYAWRALTTVLRGVDW